MELAQICNIKKHLLQKQYNIYGYCFIHLIGYQNRCVHNMFDIVWMLLKIIWGLFDIIWSSFHFLYQIFPFVYKCFVWIIEKCIYILWFCVEVLRLGVNIVEYMPQIPHIEYVFPSLCAVTVILCFVIYRLAF